MASLSSVQSIPQCPNGVSCGDRLLPVDYGGGSGADRSDFAETQKDEIRHGQTHAPKEKPSTETGEFRLVEPKAKSLIVTQLVRIARKERLDYAAFLYVCQQARRRLGLRKPPKERSCLSSFRGGLKKFFRVLQQCGNLQHEIMLKLLFFSAVRVSELVKVKVTDIDFAHCKIFIAQGKGRKDRYILFPTSFRLVLQSHLRANPKNRYLFETTRYTLFTPRRVQQIVKQYREQAGITQHVHPHLFRHQMITYLTARGLSDSQIQLISGHGSKKSLEIYQHLSLQSVEKAYQDAVKTLEV